MLVFSSQIIFRNIFCQSYPSYVVKIFYGFNTTRIMPYCETHVTIYHITIFFRRTQPDIIYINYGIYFKLVYFKIGLFKLI